MGLTLITIVVPSALLIPIRMIRSVGKFLQAGSTHCAESNRCKRKDRCRHKVTVTNTPPSVSDVTTRGQVDGRDEVGQVDEGPTLTVMVLMNELNLLMRTYSTSIGIR